MREESSIGSGSRSQDSRQYFFSKRRHIQPPTASPRPLCFPVRLSGQELVKDRRTVLHFPVKPLPRFKETQPAVIQTLRSGSAFPYPQDFIPIQMLVVERQTAIFRYAAQQKTFQNLTAAVFGPYDIAILMLIKPGEGRNFSACAVRGHNEYPTVIMNGLLPCRHTPPRLYKRDPTLLLNINLMFLHGYENTLSRKKKGSVLLRTLQNLVELDRIELTTS